MTRSDVDGATLAWGLRKLSLAFPRSFATPAAVAGTGELWREWLDGHPWVTRAVFERAVQRIAWEHPGGFLPELVRVGEFMGLARGELRREREGRRLGLPVPRPLSAQELREKEARSAAAKAAARALLPERLRRPGPVRQEAPR